jgi:RNA polymerase sigma factor (sigma-70 family)
MRPSTLRHPARLAGASLLRLQSDERLAELAIAGHEAAFDAVVDRYRTPLTRYCAGIVGPGRAEDAVQQALINAHDALKRTDEVRHLRSWLYRIAHNAALNVLRAVRDDVSLDAAAGAPLMAEDGPEASFERSERFRATVAALQELPERQRAALVLRELEGRSHAEIADALGVTTGSARQHLMRARTAMRGAVTALTPYPLIVRLTETLGGPTAAGFTLTKLTAGVVATGALVGGAVGTDRVVHHHDRAEAAVERSAGKAVRAAPKRAVVRGATIALPVASGGSAGASGASGSAPSSSRSGDDRRDRKPAASGSGPGPAPGREADHSPDHRGSDPATDGRDSPEDRGKGDISGRSQDKGADDEAGGHGKSGKDRSEDAGGTSGKGKAKGKDQSSGNDDASDAPASKDAAKSHGGRKTDDGSSGSSGSEDPATVAAPTPTVTAPTTTTTGSSGSGKGSDDSSDDEDDLAPSGSGSD